MRDYLLASAFVSCASLAQAQSVQTGSIGGMSYYTLQTGTCTAATPCSVVTYLGYQSESSGSEQQDLQNYFGGAFAQSNPHTVVIAPIENGTQNADVDWGGYDSLNTPEQQQMIAVVRGVEQQMGNTVNSGDSVVTGGSLGGTGTQAALVAAGPKGTVTPGVFSAGLSFDAALWTASDPSEVAAPCGVSLMAVHGTADANQSISYDQNLQSAIDGNPACGDSFTLDPIHGAGHGTWSSSSGYEAGTGSGTPLGWLTSQLAASARSTAPATATAVTSTSPATTTPPAASPSSLTASPTIESATVKPGAGSITDDDGNTWTITTNGKIEKDGQAVAGGGDTSELALVSGTVWGRDNGDDPNRANSGGWFTLSGNGDTADWLASASRPSTGIETASTTPATTVTLAANTVQSCTAPAGGTGTFRISGGKIIGPSGQPFIARGINVSDTQLGDAASMTSMFTGLNFIRLAVYNYQDPSYYQSFINQMTAQGRVVEIEHHVETDGSEAGGSQGGIASGSWLAAESAFYAAVARAYAGNPYVWFGTTNEPPTQPGLSQWQQSTYNAIRGQGNSSIVLLEVAGWPGGWQMDMDPSVYALMTNVVWDTHFYGWVARYSMDQSTVDAALADEMKGAQTITSKDGVMPAMIAEYGPSTTGEGMDANGIQTVTAVINSGSSGTSAGSAAWHWGQQDCCNNLLAGMQYQQIVQLYINTNVVTPTTCQATASAETTLNAVQQSLGLNTPTSATGDQSTSPTASAATSATTEDPSDESLKQAADTAISQANMLVNGAALQIQVEPASGQ